MNDSTAAAIGLGVWQLDVLHEIGLIRTALDLGYRLIDTAAAYGNESAVGAALAASPVDRDDVQVVTKIWLADFDRVGDALDESRQRLQLDCIDVVLLHWPVPSRFDRTVRAFDALLSAQSAGRVRQVGVSNFLPEHLATLVNAVGVAPSVNQVEAHPYLAQPDLRRAHSELGVLTHAHSPLGGQRAAGPRPVDDPLVAEIAGETGATPGQVVLAWHRRLGMTPLPRASSPARLAENLASLAVTLTDGQTARLDALDRGLRLGPDPARVHDHSFG